MNGRRHTKQDVVRAAGRLFARHGFHGTSMRDLGSELGLLGSSLYSHVDGKNELLVEVIRSGATLFQSLASRVVYKDASATDRLRLLIEGHVQIVTEHIDEARTFLNEARFLPEEERNAIVEMRDRYEESYRTVIKDGIAAGELRKDLDPILAAILILSTLDAIDGWYRPDGPRAPDDLAARIHHFVMSGIT